MADVHSPETRSFNMSMIHGKDTKPEVNVRKYLYAHGFRYRKNDKSLPGKPDIVLPKYHTVIFVNGCFWHCHEGCKYYVFPKSNTEFWAKKLGENVRRDKANYEKLKAMGWHVLIVWECEIRHSNSQICLDKICQQIKDHWLD